MGNNHSAPSPPPAPSVPSSRTSSFLTRVRGPFGDVALLSRDVFFLISRFLSAADLCHCAQSCRHLARVVSNDAIWQSRLCSDSLSWQPYSPLVAPGTPLPPSAPSWRALYLSMARQARARRISFSSTVGGNVRLMRHALVAEHFSSYGTSKSAQSFSHGLHFCEVLVLFASHYAGVGVIRDSTHLPDAGTGAWLSTGAIQWVTGSGLWGYTTHMSGCDAAFQTGDRVGVLLDLRRAAEKGGRVYWYLEGRYVGGSVQLQPSREGEKFAFCFCVGDGGAEITRTVLPDQLPPGCPPPHDDDDDDEKQQEKKK